MPSARGQIMQVLRILDERRISSSPAKLIIRSLFTVFIDGYDTGVIGFAAPKLLDTWGINNRAPSVAVIFFVVHWLNEARLQTTAVAQEAPAE